MRLKRLEIQGFKSFGQPVTLEFGPGITAIVGPNGSGKSNISDALRWVLGEQSVRSLRGSRLEDIIFAGSDGKRPVGMAEVRVTLDNSDGYLPLDYSEVTITRRVYRSGDSEFFINKQSCRLKDIQDLFTDTGLGRESYAVVGQGQIDQVLSVRSEDRRILLEETAGIVKYRQRKEEALRKLEETSVDLLRVTDVLHELESQLGPLEEQAKQARLYLSLADQLRAAELDYYHLVWESLSRRAVKVEEDHQRLQAEYAAGKLQQDSLEDRAAALEAQENLLQEEIEAKRQELAELMEAYQETLHSIELHRERVKNQKVRREQLDALVGAKEGELALLAQEEDKLRGELEGLLEQLRAQEQAVASAAKAVSGLQERQRQARGAVDRLKDEFFEFMRELADKRNFQRSFHQRREGLEQQLSRADQELAEAEERLAALEAELQALQRRGEEIQELLRRQAGQERELKAQAAALEASLQALEGRRRELEAQQARLTARLRTLQELEEGYEGYAAGVRRILQSSEMSPLVLGTVADVIQVPEGLETALEVALGSGLQNLITEGEKEAKALIAWLQKVQGGRVTILPLETVQGSEFSPQARALLSQPGVLGPALELIGCEARFRPALASLLGRVVITEDLDTALRLRRTLKQFARIVTRDGSVVFPTGAMTGGSWNARTAGLLARKGELTRLERELEALAGKLAAVRQEQGQLSGQLAQNEASLNQLQGEIVEAKLALQGAAQKKEQVGRERERLALSSRELKARLADLQGALDALSAEYEQAAAEVSQLELEEQLLREHIHKEEEGLAELAASLEQLSQEHTGQQLHLVELKGLLENKRTQLSNLVRRKEEALAAVDQAQGEMTELAAQQRENEAYIKQAAAGNAQRQVDQQELRRELEEKLAARQGLQQEKAELGAELKEVQREQLRRERALYRLEVELGQLESQEEQVRETLAERGLSLAAILNREVQAKEPELKARIEELRQQIRDLGLVNPTAHEEYERVLERCSFLENQLADLNEARAGLLDVISEMDKLCRTRLQEVFDQVRLEFQKLFSWLFQGGSADLVMTDPQSILTTGIDVLARPPGKKLQNLLLLSGGERALTAIALLFAIRRVKPVPFWVLDEIDATLDESNLHRFNQLMQEFAQDTQFLVVTHRQTTMESAHTLYGVTMGEEGVSQIISVALKQEE